MPQDTSTTTQTLTAAGPGPWVLIDSWEIARHPATLMAAVTGTLTYNIEITGDDVTAMGYLPANTNAFAMPNFTGLAAGTTGSLGSTVTAIRANVTAYTSGALTFQTCQYRRT